MKREQIKKFITEKIQKKIGAHSIDAFLFGSFAREEHFHDIDIGIIGAQTKQLSLLREEFEESSFPYEVDIIDFSHVDDAFKEKIFNSGVVWITKKKK